MSDYTPTTEEVSNTDSAKPWTPTTQYVVERYADDWQGGTTSERVAQFDRWFAEVKAQAIVEDRAQLLDIAKGNLKGCSGYGCDECESVMFIDDIVVQRQIMSGEVRELDS